MSWLKVLEPPVLTPGRVRLAYATAVVADVVQFALGPLGWVGADQIVDVIAMGVMWQVLGFHPLLLPTFVLEFLPITDVLPTWTGCVAIVVALRKRQHAVPTQPPEAEPGQVIDVEVSRVE
jgi:hypothetical protein